MKYVFTLMMGVGKTSGKQIMWIVVQYDGQSTRFLNEKSFDYFMKKQLGLDKAMRTVIYHNLDVHGKHELDLSEEKVA